jgi:CelD/BcsL family acetyltransferase involved in cellulose biosynthesis
MVDTYLRSTQARPERLSRSASCDVSIYEGADAVEQAAAAWHALEGSAGTTPFQSLSVAQAAARAHAAKGERPRIIVVREKGSPVVVFPTVICRFAGLAMVRFLGDPFIQYGDALVSPDAAPAHLTAAWSAAANPRLARIGMFRRVRSDSPLASLLAREAIVIASDEAPFVDVITGERTNGRYAREVRRLRRRLAERGPVAFEVQQGPAAIDILRETLVLKRAWLVERGLPSAVLGNTHWEEVLLAAATTSSDPRALTAARLTVAGETAATEIGLTDAKTWYAYIAALVPAFAKYGPGHVLMDDILAWCAETKRTVYDLLPPSQPYKHALATGSVPVRDYAIASGPLGHAAVLTARALPAVKRSVTALPLGLRQHMVSVYLRITTK